MSVEAVKSEEVKVEENKPMTMEEVKSEHNNLCVQAGYLQYRMECDKEQLHMLNNRIRDLNLKAADLQKAEADKPVPEAVRQSGKVK